jgi:hypothetical protein
MKPKHLYLILCGLGAVVPYAVFLPWVAVHGFNLRLFVQEIFANRISIFFALDVVVSAAVVLAFAAVERRRLRLRFLWLIIPAPLFVGVSLALPLLLYLRESALDELQAKTLASRAR